MIKRSSLTLAVILSIAPLAAALAQSPPAPKPVSAADRHAVLQALAATLQANYVFPDVAKTVSASLLAKEASGGYAAVGNTEAFAEALSTDLRTLGEDGHFQVGYDPDFRAPPPANTAPSKAELEQRRQEIADHGFGIQKVELLPGNVGYLEVRGFGPGEFVSEAFDAALNLLSGSEALVLDLRRNGGGEPESVAYLMSHFSAAGDARHLNDIYTRPGDSTRQYWTSAAVQGRYGKPVYVLTSARTFSGGEECAYDFQTQKRAILVGETTGGGANPGDGFALAKGFAAFIPTGRAINPVTHTNWEHVGVKPDIAVPAADALKTAHAAILRGFLATSKVPEERQYLQEVLAKVESGVADVPNYKPPH